MKTVADIRRDNLLVAIKRAGTAANLAAAAQVSTAYLSQVKSRQPESSSGRPRNMGDDVARRIEKALGEPVGWMDTPRGDELPDTGLAARIAAIIASRGISHEQLESVAGVAPGVVAKWLSGVARDIGHDQAARIQEAYGYNVFWLITGRGNEFIPSLRAAAAKPAPKYLNAYPPNSFPARLHHAMRLRGVRQNKDVANAGGVSANAVNLWFKGDVQIVDNDHATALAKFLRVQSDWLLHGVGPMEGDANVRPAEVGRRRIPLISSVQAGLMHEAVEPLPPGTAFEYLLTDMDLSEHAFALEIEGRSMEPEFREGDRIIIDPAVRPIPGDFVVAANGQSEATFKKYRPRGIGESGVESFDLVPLNPDYPTISSDREPARVIGVMVEHRRYRRR